MSKKKALRGGNLGGLCVSGRWAGAPGGPYSLSHLGSIPSRSTTKCSMES